LFHIYSHVTRRHPGILIGIGLMQECGGEAARGKSAGRIFNENNAFLDICRQLPLFITFTTVL